MKASEKQAIIDYLEVLSNEVIYAVHLQSPMQGQSVAEQLIEQMGVLRVHLGLVKKSIKTSNDTQ